MTNDIKKKQSNLNFLARNRDNANEQLNSLNYEAKNLEQIINNFNSLKQNEISNNYFPYNNRHEETLRKINNLETEMKNEIVKANNDKRSLIINEISSKIQNNQYSGYLIKDSFYNEKDKTDSTYNKLKEEEKKGITKIFNENKEKIINMISNSEKIHSIKSITKKIIQQISKNEDSYNIFKNKILNEIKIIANDNIKCEIKYLTILLVGRKGIEKQL